MVVLNDKTWKSIDSWFSKQPMEKVDCGKAERFIHNLLTFSDADGTLFLNKHGCQKYKPDIDIDATGFEGSLNSAHMGDLFKLTPENALNCVYQYIKLIKESSQQMGVDGKIAFIVGLYDNDEHYDVVIKFHRYRRGEHYLSDDLDGFEEKIMILVL